MHTDLCDIYPQFEKCYSHRQECTVCDIRNIYSHGIKALQNRSKSFHQGIQYSVIQWGTFTHSICFFTDKMSMSHTNTIYCEEEYLPAYSIALGYGYMCTHTCFFSNPYSTHSAFYYDQFRHICSDQDPSTSCLYHGNYVQCNLTRSSHRIMRPELGKMTVENRLHEEGATRLG